jgi:hypothetical protein
MLHEIRSRRFTKRMDALPLCSIASLAEPRGWNEEMDDYPAQPRDKGAKMVPMRRFTVWMC